MYAAKKLNVLTLASSVLNLTSVWIDLIIVVFTKLT